MIYLILWILGGIGCIYYCLRYVMESYLDAEDIIVLICVPIMFPAIFIACWLIIILDSFEINIKNPLFKV